MAIEPLYIFLHIPRCAGTTITEQLGLNLGRNDILRLSPMPQNRLQKREDVDNYIQRIPRSQIDQFRVIAGHSVYFGIHEQFDRPARYVTILRDPVARAISNYHHYRANFDLFKSNDYDNRFPARKDDLTFENWWPAFNHNLQLAHVLNYQLENKYATDMTLTDEHLHLGEQILDQFYFVGLAETLETDMLFLSGLLGAPRFIKKPTNASRVVTTVDESIARKLVRLDSNLDCQLYAHARNLNQKFKDENPDFTRNVEIARESRVYVNPIRLRMIQFLMRTIGTHNVVKLSERKQRVQNFLRNIRN